MCSQVCEVLFKPTNTSLYSVLACSLEKTQDENFSSWFNFCLQSWRTLQGTEMKSKVWYNTAFGHSCFSSVSFNLQGIILPPNQSPFAFFWVLFSLLTHSLGWLSFQGDLYFFLRVSSWLLLKLFLIQHYYIEILYFPHTLPTLTKYPQLFSLPS